LYYRTPYLLVAITTRNQTMSDGDLLLTIVAVIAVLLFLLSWILPALKESGHLKAPKFGRKSQSSFRPHPPVQGGEDFEIY
jgi:hypothetical protein